MRPSLEVCRNHNQRPDVLGAEIGVALGDNASDILKNWPDVRLILVDSYWHSLEWATRTQERLTQFNDRIEWKIMDSQEASRDVKDLTLDFAYIDASHSYRDVYMDVRLWWEKLRFGGILCGHDFFEEPGVSMAVNEFVLKRNLLLNARWHDWWVFKT